MKANELRIGNYAEYNGISGIVYCIQSPYPRKEKRFNDKELVTLIIGGLSTVCLDDCNPIQLTEEWLIKLGFKCIGNNYYLDYGSIEIGLMSSKRFYIQIRSENTTLDVKFVHQLQNLYFALTEQELTPQD